MKIIDDTIYRALEQLRGEAGSNTAMARKLGLSDSMMSRIMRRKSHYFEDATWERIRPELDRFLNYHCPAGYAHCPLTDTHLEKLLRNILSVKDPGWYDELNDMVEQKLNRRRNRPTQSTQAFE